MSRWPLPSCYLWSWAIYIRLSRASLVSGYCPGLVPKVRPNFFFGSAPNNRQLVRCDGHPNDLDADDTRRRSHQKTGFLINTFDPGILWDDFGVRSDIMVRLSIFL